MDFDNKNKKSYDVKEGIKFHRIETNKFKTNLFSVFLTTPLNKENVTQNALLAAVLRRGTQSMPTQDQISKKLEELYGAEFNCGIEKIGDNTSIKFYLEAINDKFILDNKEDLTSKCIEILFEIVLNPLTEDGKFKEEYVEGEKENLRQIIEGKKDNKSKYAYDRCIEEMFKDKVFGLYKFGDIGDLEKITSEELYSHYKKIISECKIDILVSGEFDSDIFNLIKENKDIMKIKARKPVYNIEDEQRDFNNEKVIEEKLDVTQGKLIMALNMLNNIDNGNNVAMVYNGILGGGANSKLFQNVRERASLAYYANSGYLKRKGLIFIKCGIEIENYEKAVKIIKEQIKDIKSGNFTDEDVENSKKIILSVIQNIQEEQDTEIIYYYNQELVNNNETIREYMDKVRMVKKDDIVKLAEGINVDTIYFLRN
ncbi:MAG: pitrilysin family protein [Clostridia bacterium]|nr:pitrilysin family protein [Clostridia bacterium]